MSPSDDDFDFLSREEVLGGLSARRASAVLFALERRTAHLAQRARRVGARYLTERSAAEEEEAFLDALAQGRDAAKQLRIQDLERHAPLWAPLVPPDSNLRAAIANLLANKYRLTRQDVPALRRALGLDDVAVQTAYQRQFGKPIGNIYAARVGGSEQLRWMWRRFRYRLEDLPPFWSAFGLTFTETVGAGILALPIAFAAIGPLGGVLVLVVLGLVNILTITALSEAITHNGNMRYGNSYFGRLVHDYFGSLGSSILTVALVLLNLFVLLAFYIGLTTTLQGATGLSALIWGALLFGVQLYFLRRESIDATIASALLIGAVNTVLIFILILLTLPHVRVENLSALNLPGVNGQPFDSAILGLIFGVALFAYFGHTSAGNVAKVALRRDPGGGSLIWGNLAAMGAAMVVYALWVLVVNSAVNPIEMAAQTGTALIPLATTVGPIVFVFGSLFAVLGMGMGSIHFGLGLFYQVRERLPSAKSENTVSGKPEENSSPLFWANPRVRFGLSVAPVLFVFLLAEFLLWTHQESFTGAISTVGALAVPIVAGIFPMLLLAASRRRADYVARVAPPLLGNWTVVAVICGIFLASLAAHGLVIWSDPIMRLAALAVAALMVGLIIVLFRRNAFRLRRSVEIRLEQNVEPQTFFNVVAAGKPASTIIQLDYPEGERQLNAAQGMVPNAARLRAATFKLGANPIRELKVWTHTITAEGDSLRLALEVQVHNGGESRKIEMDPKDGSAILSIGNAASQIEFDFPMNLPPGGV